MAVKTARKPVPAPPPAKAVKAAAKPEAPAKVTETPAALSWDELPPAQVTEYARVIASAGRPSVEETTPEPIKVRVKEGFEKTKAKGETVFQTQQCLTPDHAEQFVKLLKRYAAHTGVTARAKVLTDSEVNTLVQRGGLPAGIKTGTVVSFAIKEKETRTRKPKEDAATK